MPRVITDVFLDRWNDDPTPSSVIIAETSGSGKSELVEQWLRYQNVFQVKPKTMVYAFDRWQPRFDRMQKRMAFDSIAGYRTPVI